jgi:hypothetical protein
LPGPGFQQKAVGVEGAEPVPIDRCSAHRVRGQSGIYTFIAEPVPVRHIHGERASLGVKPQVALVGLNPGLARDALLIHTIIIAFGAVKLK